MIFIIIKTEFLKVCIKSIISQPLLYLFDYFLMLNPFSICVSLNIVQIYKKKYT